MKTELAIRREYKRAERLLTSKTIGGSLGNQLELRGARQALGWVLQDNAMAPVKAAGFPRKKKA